MSAHVGWGGGWWWNSWDWAYEINITLTQSCSHGHACKPDYPKIGQWNTTQQTHMHTHGYIHTHTHMHQYQLEESEPCQCRVACLRPAFNAATHIFPQNRHVLWTGTTGLRSGQKGRETAPRLPPYHPPWPSAPPPSLNATSNLRWKEKRTKKNFCPGAPEMFLSCAETGWGFYRTSSRQ